MFDNSDPTTLARRQVAARRGAPHRRQHRRTRCARCASRCSRPTSRCRSSRISSRASGDKAIGEEVIGSLTPGQALIGVVHRELAATDGRRGGSARLRDAAAGGDPAGGTAGRGQDDDRGQARAPAAQTQKKKVLLVSADVYRPAAIEQLETLASQVGVDFFPSAVGEQPVGDCRARRSTGRASTITTC